MKKFIVLISFLCLSLLIQSCSDSTSDSMPATPDNITLTVDGNTITYTNVEVTESTYIFEDLNVPTYNVLATPDEDNGHFIAFQIRRDYTGTEGLYTFIYNDEQGSHTFSDNFTFNITQNNANKLVGTFSGPLFQEEITPSVTISNGSFVINY